MFRSFFGSPDNICAPRTPVFLPSFSIRARLARMPVSLVALDYRSEVTTGFGRLFVWNTITVEAILEAFALLFHR